LSSPRGQGFGFDVQYSLGYAAALCAAIIWAAYSVLSRRFAAVSSDAIAGFCLVTALLATICHLLLEPTVWPGNPWQWAALIGLGLGPVGLAFFVWDIRGQARRYPGARRARVLLRPAALDADPDPHRLCDLQPPHPDRLPADHRRRRAGRQGPAVPPALCAAAQ
jgi:hypothetical protein